MTEVLTALAQLSVLVFVIGSMFSLGLSLTMTQILDPLKNARMVILALVANFVLVPVLAYAIAFLFNLDDSLRTGLILLSTAAGAPFLPKLVDVAKGNIAFSVGLMVLLMVITIIYLPLVLPLLLGDVEVNPWDIAQSLIIMMLIPLAIGLFIKARYEDAAEKMQPIFGMAANLALIALTVLGLVLNFSGMIALIGTFGILAGIIFILVSLVIGYFLGGSDPRDRSVMGLGTAQRNISAALVVAAQNFTTDVITYLLVLAVIGLVVLMPAAGEIGKRMKGTTEAEQPSS
ncbi:MAG: bile acid:sodium symporter [Chloroflexota bacterium]|nr:MAG: bile acid:sodium symporter [Chloroflexota bacterium]